MKKLLSIFVSLLVITSYSLPCYASSNISQNTATQYEILASDLIKNSSAVSIRETDNIIKDLKTLSSVNINPSLVSEIDKIDNKIIYRIRYDNIPVNVIEIMEVTDDYTIYSVTEGDKHDIVKLTTDNKLYLDNKPVKIDTSEEIQYSAQSQLLTSNSSSQEVSYTNTNPLPSTIWVSQYVNRYADLELNKLVEICTTTVILAFITGAIGTVSSAFASCYDMAANVISAASGTNSTALSSQITVYYPQNGRHVGGQKYIEKHIGRFWPKKNYGGTVTVKTRYKIIQYF